MQRLRLTSHVHFGLALGIATAGVVLALGGCVTSTTAQAPTAKAPSANSAALEQFSEDERSRILAVQTIVAQAASEHQLDPALINAMIWVESRFDTKAKSPSGARGLMQLMPATAAYLAKRMGENSARAYDPEFNIRAGTLYLAEMLAKFGDEQRAVAAYHAGPGNVKKWVEAGQAFPSYSDAYVAKVMEARGRFVGLETHGRPSRTRVAAVELSEPAPEPRRTETVAVRDEYDEYDDGLIVPDIDTLPSAAQIHGMDEQPELEVHAARSSGPVFEEEPEYEPVFEVHPELDRDRDATPPGWATATVKPPVTVAARPRPTPTPTPTPAPSEPFGEIGLGVLPDL